MEKPTSKFKVIINNLKAIIFLKPLLASNPILAKVLRGFIFTIIIVIYAGLAYWIYRITIPHMSLDKVDLNLDGLYTFKDFVLGILGHGAWATINGMNGFLELYGEFWEIDSKVEYTTANMVRAGFFYYLYFVPLNVFLVYLAIEAFIDSRTKEDD